MIIDTAVRLLANKTCDTCKHKATFDFDKNSVWEYGIEEGSWCVAVMGEPKQCPKDNTCERYKEGRPGPFLIGG